MKKLCYWVCLIIATLTLTGCNSSSKQLLSFHEFQSDENETMAGQIAESDFFAEDLVIISEEEKHGEDEELVSDASLFINASDKEVVYANQVHDKLYPASLTKLMAALVVLRYGELTDSVTISHKASHIPEPGAKLCGFMEGDVISLDVLLHSLLIYSGNDASLAAAEHVGGSEESFVKKMNEEAKRIGAVDTNFVNSHGLHDDDQYTTAYDIYLIFNELIQYDTFLSIISTNSYTAVYADKDGNELKKTFHTTNRYLNDEEEKPEGITIIGGKTGTTKKAGNCLVLLCRDKEEKDYIAVILKASGADSLYAQMSHLMSLLEK
jgi:D-alanyl-D-alanine carboxypeptidase